MEAGRVCGIGRRRCRKSRAEAAVLFLQFDDSALKPGELGLSAVAAVLSRDAIAVCSCLLALL